MGNSKHHGTHCSSVFNGALLDADEYKILAAERRVVPIRAGLGDYAIRAGASTRLLSQLRDAEPAYKCRLTAFPSPRGRMLLTITIQLGLCQSRILFDLASPRTRAMLASLWTSNSLRILFVCDGAGLSTEFDLAVPDTAIENLLKLPLARSSETDWLADTADLAFVASHLCVERDALLVDGLAAPQDISLTEVVTYEGIGGGDVYRQFCGNLS